MVFRTPEELPRFAFVIGVAPQSFSGSLALEMVLFDCGHTFHGSVRADARYPILILDSLGPALGVQKRLKRGSLTR